MAKLKLTEVEFGQLAHKLKRMRDAKVQRQKGAQQLIKETAAKFDAGQLSFANNNEIEVPMQRRHLRLLEEVQLATLRIIEQTTIPELKSRKDKNPERADYYITQLTKASELKGRTQLLLTKIQELL